MNREERRLRSNQTEGTVEVRHVAEEFSGPLPPPNMLGEYERLLPGAAERIFKMAEEQSSHRRTLERTVIAADIRSRSRGQIFGLVIALVGLAITYLIAIAGHAIAAAVIGAVDIVGLVTVFVVGQQRKSRTLDTKREEAPKPVPTRSEG